MNSNFMRFQIEIKECFLSFDVNYFIEGFRDLFGSEKMKYVTDSSPREKIEAFLSEFVKLSDPTKFKILRDCAKKYNSWIYEFLTVNLDDAVATNRLSAKWIVLNNLLDLLRRSKEILCVVDVALLNTLHCKKVITMANRDHLLSSLKYDGHETAMFEMFNVIAASDIHWYSSVLYEISRQNTAFNAFMFAEWGGQEQITEDRFKKYVDDLIEKHINQYQAENRNDDDAFSDYGGSYDCGEEDDRDEDLLSVLDEPNDDDEIYPTELKLKKFQLELSEVPLIGENAIVYAPTGTGKTVVAVHIANEHLARNPNGKVAFLVHRTPLVTQQYRAFEKFKTSHLKVIEMRSKADNTVGPLITHMDNYQIFVMTSDILRNALTVDDGNKLSSICQFSLIFFDECHNCMKLHPYMKIMREYFTEKRVNGRQKFPQIVGLTASPRSNKKDDTIGMQKALFELCANLDCTHFAMVKRNIQELEEEMTQPKQEVVKIGQRLNDAFEMSLLRNMTKCEIKLEEMKVQGYFPDSEIKVTPSNKFEDIYISFVGNLEKQSTMTITENDGKQKAYCIYRYLNAYYRGLIVNQMFDQYYAKETIRKFLNHNGKVFTCSYDEEFYRSYKELDQNCDDLELSPAKKSRTDLAMHDGMEIGQQSRNPSIEIIKTFIKEQLEEKPDSRILIFVRQVDYTYYLVNELKNSDGSIAAEAIVGSSSKNNTIKGCTISDMNEILARFTRGDTKVLVATTVVEEGLDVGLCNMVISYGHVTNETALVQRRGRARSIDSRYILILPPMLIWLEKKEILNERRKDMMMNLIKQFGIMELNKTNMKRFVSEYQQKNFFIQQKSNSVAPVDNISWIFKCKLCRQSICTSEDLRIIEKMHRVCIDRTIMTKFTVIDEEKKTFGSQKYHEITGTVMCKCQNNEIGKVMVHKGVRYLQLLLSACNIVSCKRPKPLELSLKKWKEFEHYYAMADMTSDDVIQYCSGN